MCWATRNTFFRVFPTPACPPSYRRAQPGAMRAGFSYYRGLPKDIEDNLENIKRLKLPMPVLAIGGGVSYPHGRGRGEQTQDSLRRVANNVKGKVFDNCGHFIPEEAPKRLNEELISFF